MLQFVNSPVAVNGMDPPAQAAMCGRGEEMHLRGGSTIVGGVVEIKRVKKSCDR